MVDKLTELEERFNKLEEKLKITFIELERRLDQQQPQSQSSSEDRIQELEDLLLLLQLENTKLKEKVGDGLDFGIIPNVPGVSERLTRVESELAAQTSATPIQSEIETKIATLEERINSLQTTNYVETRPVDEPVDEPVEEHVALQHNKKKVKTVKEVLEEDSDLLSSVQRILGRA
ncbi:MAG: hypothetical protein WC613_00385 [Candidatus Aenigmatarchaeota archaeon]